MDSDYKSWAKRTRVQVAVFSCNHPCWSLNINYTWHLDTGTHIFDSYCFCYYCCFIKTHVITAPLSSCSLFRFFSKTIAEFDLGAVNYEVKSPKCHELSLAAPPHDRISFNFRCEQEAQEWATVLMSSLREAHRGQLAFRQKLAVLLDNILSKMVENIHISY